jgi:hypothetical protein
MVKIKTFVIQALCSLYLFQINQYRKWIEKHEEIKQLEEKNSRKFIHCEEKIEIYKRFIETEQKHIGNYT